MHNISNFLLKVFYAQHYKVYTCSEHSYSYRYSVELTRISFLKSLHYSYTNLTTSNWKSIMLLIDDNLINAIYNYNCIYQSNWGKEIGWYLHNHFKYCVHFHCLIHLAFCLSKNTSSYSCIASYIAMQFYSKCMEPLHGNEI